MLYNECGIRVAETLEIRGEVCCPAIGWLARWDSHARLAALFLFRAGAWVYTHNYMFKVRSRAVSAFCPRHWLSWLHGPAIASLAHQLGSCGPGLDHLGPAEHPRCHIIRVPLQALPFLRFSCSQLWGASPANITTMLKLLNDIPASTPPSGTRTEAPL